MSSFIDNELLVRQEHELLVYFPDTDVGKERDRCLAATKTLLEDARLATSLEVVSDTSIVSLSTTVEDKEAIGNRLRAVQPDRVYVTCVLEKTTREACLVQVEGMTCNSCVKLIESTLPNQCNGGVVGVMVALKRKEAFVEFDPSKTNTQDVAMAIYDMGFDVELKRAFPEPLISPRSLSLSPIPPVIELTLEPKTVVIDITGMTCQSCVQNITNSLKEKEGINEIMVSLERNNATITYNPSKVNPQELCSAIDDLGFEAVLPSNKGQVSPKTTICYVGIEGMTCHSCVSLIESTLSKTDGILSVHVSLPNKEGTVEFSKDVISTSTIKETVEDMGFDVTYVTESKTSQKSTPCCSPKKSSPPRKIAQVCIWDALCMTSATLVIMILLIGRLN